MTCGCPRQTGWRSFRASTRPSIAFASTTSGELFSSGLMVMHPKWKSWIITKMKKLKNIHPGEVLKEEFMVPLDITAYRLSKEIGIPQTRISEILKGRRRITADTALRLSQYFGNSAKFWLGLQDDYDIEEGMQISKEEIQSIVRFDKKVA